MKTQLTTNQLKRMPKYLDLLRALENNGIKFISCQTIADCLDLNKEQVRKDIAQVSTIDGIPNKGRDINLLIKDMEKVLGLEGTNNAILIGTGNLGSALLKYRGFDNFGLKIVAAFDNDESVIGSSVNGIEIFAVDRLKDVLNEYKAQIAILTVSAASAQKIADYCVECGVEAIWNFVPVQLEIDSNVIVSNMDMAQSLATLSHRLYLKHKKEKRGK